jgi:hypothetical protein
VAEWDAKMEEYDFDGLKKDLDEQTTFYKWKKASYDAQMKAVEDQLDIYEIDCAVFKSKRCLEMFDGILVKRRRFRRVLEMHYSRCCGECDREKPRKWMILAFDDIPMRNEEERGLYTTLRSCMFDCSRVYLRTLRSQLQELIHIKQQVEADFLQTGKDPLRVSTPPDN